MSNVSDIIVKNVKNFSTIIFLQKVKRGLYQKQKNLSKTFNLDDL